MDKKETVKQIEKELNQQGAKLKGTGSQIANYQKIARYSDVLIHNAFKLALEGDSDAVRISATKLLLNKILPDLKSIELTGGINEDGTRSLPQLFINTGTGFIPATVRPYATSTGSATQESSQVQDAGMASKGEKDDNSNIRDSETSTS